VPAHDLATTPKGDLWIILGHWFEDSKDRLAEGKPEMEWALAHRDVATGEWSVFDEDLPEGVPFAIFADDDAVWLAQGYGIVSESHGDFEGVIRFDGETWTQYLTGEVIGDVAVTPDGRIWYTVPYDGTLRQLR
jgi:hypothetical protein